MLQKGATLTCLCSLFSLCGFLLFLEVLQCNLFQLTLFCFCSPFCQALLSIGLSQAPSTKVTAGVYVICQNGSSGPTQQGPKTSLAAAQSPNQVQCCIWLKTIFVQRLVSSELLASISDSPKARRHHLYCLYMQRMYTLHVGFACPHACQRLEGSTWIAACKPSTSRQVSKSRTNVFTEKPFTKTIMIVICRSRCHSQGTTLRSVNQWHCFSADARGQTEPEKHGELSTAPVCTACKTHNCIAHRSCARDQETGLAAVGTSVQWPPVSLSSHEMEHNGIRAWAICSVSLPSSELPSSAFVPGNAVAKAAPNPTSWPFSHGQIAARACCQGRQAKSQQT